MTTNIYLKAALNGSRAVDMHPALPVTADNIALDARAAIAAGAAAIHFHVRDLAGFESLADEDVARCIEACRRAVPSTPIGISTGEWIVPDIDERLHLIANWHVLPDFCSVNFHEQDAEHVAALLAERGIGVEVGLINAQAAEKALRTGWLDRCVRILIEPSDESLDAALATVDEIEQTLSSISLAVPRLLHGADTTAWALVAEAARRGYQSRMGLEDTFWLPDGEVAESNEELVSYAIAMMASESSEA